MKVLLLGRSGKMGRMLEQLLKNENHEVSGPMSSKEEVTFSNIDVCIDFSRPDYLLDQMSEISQNRIPLITGTTGLNDQQLEQLKTFSEQSPVFWSSNFSLGVYAITQASSYLAKQLGNYADINISEQHHKHKVDSPSGTALSIGAAISAEIKDKEITYHSTRAGEIVGEHSIQFTLDHEVIEIKHRALNRNAFAFGAIAVIPFIMSKQNGFYSMNDLDGE